MGTSLQQGIDAAKAGKLGLALEHLKNAVVEEPENPEVWVWFSGIIDDEEKQIIFLKKALELDPNNRQAQRGLAYLQRQKYVPSQSAVQVDSPDQKKVLEEDETQPDYPDPEFMTLNVQSFAKQVDALGDPKAPSKKEIIREHKALVSKGKKHWLDILIYSVTLIVFTIIGILIGATIKNRRPILPSPTEKAPVLVQIPGEGVYLSADNQFFKMALSHNEPADGPGLPSTSETRPVIRAASSILEPTKLQLVNKKNVQQPITIETLEDHTYSIVPDTPLAPGRYCLVNVLSEGEQALYWCFKVTEITE